MEFEKNIIQKVVFEVDYYDKNLARSMQNKVISEFNLNISEKIDKVFTEHTKGYLIRKKNLVIDLGVITKENCENNLTHLIEQKLQAYLLSLKRKLEVKDFPSDIEVIELSESLYDYLYNYLRYGKVDWNHESFSNENTLGHWFYQLSDLSPDLFNKVLKLFKLKEPRIRFLNVVPLHKDISLINEVFPMLVRKKLYDVGATIKNILKISKLADYEEITGDFLLSIASEIPDNPKKELDVYYISKSFYDYLQIEQEFEKSELLLQIIQKKDEFFDANSKTFVSEISRIYFSDKSKTFDFTLEMPDKLADSYNIWETFQKSIERQIPAWSRLIIEVTHKIVRVIEKKYSKPEKESFEKIIRKLVLETIITTEFPKDIDLWNNVLLDQVLHIFGNDLQKEIQKIVSEVLSKGENIQSIQKRIVLDKIVISDRGVEYQINLDTTLRYLRFFAKVGFVGLQSYFAEPVSVLEQLLLSLKSIHPRYYPSEIEKIASVLSITDLKLISESSINYSVKQDIVKSSGYELVISKLVNVKDNYVGFLIIEVLTGSIIPTQYINEYGFGRISNDIKIFLGEHKDILLEILNLLKIRPENIQLEYFKRITDNRTFKLLSEIIDPTEQITEKQIKPDSGVDSIVKFQLGIELFFLDKMSSIQKKEFETIIRSLIDIRNDDFAKFIIAQPIQRIEHIKHILPVTYKEKIDRMIKSVRDNLQTYKEERISEQVFHLKEGESIYIRNSGLIILNPYMNTLFNRLGYIENKKFISDKHRSKAIQAMHFLVTGTTNWEEPDIVLNKILAGLEPNDVVRRVEDITTEEKNMCEGLLDAVLKNWGVLQKTSIDSLRGSFFIRNGKLSFELSSWRLVVERKSYDVLLDKLPWSFSTIKLPWMEYPLISEW